MAEALPNNTEAPICHFFLNSTCLYGSKCRFSHRLPENGMRQGDGICKFYLKGNCRFGNKCWNRHGPSTEIEPHTSNSRQQEPTTDDDDAIPRLCEAFACGRPCDAACAFMHGDACPECGEARLHPLDPAQRQVHVEQCTRDRREKRMTEAQGRRGADKSCGICLEVVCEKAKVSDRKFGVLESCDHIFCFQCIMRWRKVKGQQEDMDAVSLSCPLCRTPSSLVAPCRVWPCTAQEKRRLIADKRDALRQRPCATFSRWGHCPRGDLCLYHHRNTRKNRDLSPPPEMYMPPPELDLMESLLLLDLMDEEYFSEDSSDFDPEDYMLLHEMDLEILGQTFNFW